ncbi:hypothetical protein ACQEVM_17630 [Streptomyces sp. CA-243310]|uniref:hypothetical protein n=1 Tax=Streptomyces sp. CA-243310 TaxID=3240056 RepID=UPI003D8FACB3
MAAIKDIYNDSWSGELRLRSHDRTREFDHLIRQMKPFMRPELVQIAEVHGRPAAFTLVMPDTNQALAAARGRLTTYGLPLGLLRIPPGPPAVIDRIRAIATWDQKGTPRPGALAAALLTQAQRTAFRLGYNRDPNCPGMLEDNRGRQPLHQGPGRHPLP